MSSYQFSILLILIAVNNAKAINYASYRVNDTVSDNVTCKSARTTRDILEKLNNIEITSPESLQDGTEHLLQFGALLRTKILDTFGELIYDHYDEFNMNELHALYKIYMHTLERKYNIFDIVPNVLINSDIKPLAICNYMNLHVKTCLRDISSSCTATKFPIIYDESANDTRAMDTARSIYNSARLEEKYKNGISLLVILDLLKNNHLQFTVELLSGLLHNVQYDDYDDGVRTAERELIHYFLKNPRRSFQRSLLKPHSIKHYNSITQLLKGFLRSYLFPKDIKRHAEYLAAHILREPTAINENIELLGAAYETADVNLKYLFELILPDDTIDSDVIDARNYLLEQLLKQNIVEKYLNVEKYQQANPSYLLVGILGQIRDINFASDIATSLQTHAKFWHTTHMIGNFHQLLELFDTYENLRGIPDYSKLMSTIDRLRIKLMNTNNATIEISCTNPRKCLRIALKIILQCPVMSKETKKLINKFLDKSNFQCTNEKELDKHGISTTINNESVSKKPFITTTRKNLGRGTHKPENSSQTLTLTTTTTEIFNETTELPMVPTTNQSTPNCHGDELCEEDEVLATGNGKQRDTNITTESTATTQIIDSKIPQETLITPTELPKFAVSTELPETNNLLHHTITTATENITTDICDNLSCQTNPNQTLESITIPSTQLDIEKDINESPSKHLNHSNTGTTLSISISPPKNPLTKVTINTEHLSTTTSTPILTTAKLMCHHRDPHYRKKIRRLDKTDRLTTQPRHHQNSESLKTLDTSKETANHLSSASAESKKSIEVQNNSESKKKLLTSNVHVMSSEADSDRGQRTSNKHSGLKVKHVNMGSASSLSMALDESGHHELSQSNGSIHDTVEASQIKVGKAVEATEHRHQKTKLFQKLSRRNFKNSHHSNSSQKHTKKVEISSAIPESNESTNKLNHVKSSELSSSTDETIKLSNNNNDSNAQTRLFDWNMPLFSNYDVAMNDKDPVDKKNYRSRRNIEDKNYTNDQNATDNVKGRLFDINVPFFSNYDLALNDKPPVDKENYRSRRESQINKNDNINTQIKERLFDFNMPIGSNVDLKMNDKPPASKTNYRSRRGIELNGNNDTTISERFLDINIGSGVTENNDKPSVNKINNRTRREVETENGPNVDARLFDINMPMASNQDWKLNDKSAVEKNNYRSRRSADVNNNTSTSTTTTTTNTTTAVTAAITNTTTTAATTTSTTNSPLNIDNRFLNINNTLSSSTTIRTVSDNSTTTDSHTTEKINVTTVGTQ